MNGEKLLKLLISFLIIAQVLGFIFKNTFLNTYSGILIISSIIILYFGSARRINIFHVIVLLVLFLTALISFFSVKNILEFQIILQISVYVLLFYFLYYNHKSFLYNKRDIFTLILGSLLYTVIFFMAYQVLRETMRDLHILGFIHLLLLYILLVVAGIHFVNIRSEKSLWFFLSMLNFAFRDYMWLIDQFYLPSYELKVLILICNPLAMVFLVNYMVTESIKLKSDEFEGL